jgi:hypothetical protein
MKPAQAGLALALAAALAPSLRAEGPRVTVRGNGTDLGPTPIVAPIDVDLRPGSYYLISEGDAPALGANVIERDGRRCLGLMLDRLGADETREFRLRTAEELMREIPADAKVETETLATPEGDSLTLSRVDVLGEAPIVPIRVEAGEAEVRVLAGRGPFATLRQGERKPYFWPVVGPSEAAITRAFPMEDVEGEDHDHPHQRSFWFTHGDVNGWDFWASDPKNPPNPRFGTIRRAAMDQASGGPAVGVIRTSDEWLGGDGKKVCDDDRVFVFAASEHVRFIDADITIRATAGPVTFGDTKEGTFGLRLASSMNANRKPGGRIVNAEGIADTAAWGKPSPWVDYSGPVGEKTVGVAIFDSPENLRHPTTWHVRDYGLFAANPFGYRDFGVKGEGKYTIPAGGSLRFRYRVMLHEGDAESAGVAAAYRAFAEPPKVEVSAD